jgi:tol-pal system protein YbgF
MTRSIPRLRTAAAFAFVFALAATPSLAQDRGPNFLDNLFNRGGEQGEAQPGGGSGAGEMSTRLGRIEGVLRQLTGNIEELQHRNQVLEQQVRELQQRAGLSVAPGAVAMPPSGAAPPMAPAAPVAPPATPGRRFDVFDPGRQPNAPGAPRSLGGGPSPAPSTAAAGAPLDLSTLSNNPSASSAQSNTMASAQPGMTSQPPRDSGAAGGQLATLPPSARPQDEYDLAYGYVLHKDYGLAVQAFRDFLRKYPQERLVPDAQFWLGDALFRQQQYREAAEAFLAVSTKYEHSGKAADALLRLGQSLAELHQKEAACATLAQVGRKYPNASASVKRAATQELKKQHC